ncbi:ABC transporter ATP-binding protein [Rhodobium gokarnense]|uniref:ABC-2 type transport system ATP-binding protein n=1 Tax=Rhodobium gokarnense TaxID=364296 RepID=A0ABT3H8T9_9HYPH|nr:ABC transporter ATP-binding protein [Rhodobium gokarnense]MCW2306806.1 ABC-2 type transport system ATP-binding protein [Rhodobium gokarnense]
MTADAPGADQPNAIDVTGITKSFSGKTVVDDVDLTVRHGEIVGFLGPNGSGKTTTIRVICGLLLPDAGAGTVLGYDVIREARRIKHQVGYMTQHFSFYGDLTIAENLDFVARLYGLKPRRKHVLEALKGLGMASRADQLAETLSGGWKQRLALAACIMHKPKLLLLDEPTAGVDPKARRDFWDEIHQLAADGLTVLVSTHYMDEAERCHRIAYISYGKLIAQGTVADIVAGSNLITYVVEGPDLARVQRRLQDTDGIEQIAPFGATLHVVGSDPGRLKAALRPLEEDAAYSVRPADTSLEDVFIKFMGTATDNMQ